MSKALDLLNTLSADEIAELTAQPDPEGHIIVGGDRIIRVPENLKRIAVQFDHNVETVTFDCPRYWDNKDMTKMAVYINYMLPNGYKDRYPADNVRADGEVMHFEWTISRNVTQIKGNISFLVCVVKTNTDGNEENHWNSELNRDLYVSEGMECEESPEMEYPDLITQLLLRMNSVEQINVQAQEMQQLYDNTMNASEAAEAAANGASIVFNDINQKEASIRNSYANAIKGKVSGETVRVDDVSPIEHDVKCRVHGKNLFDISQLQVTTISESEYGSRGYISAVTDNSITITTYEGHTSNGYTICGKTLAELCPGLRVGDVFVVSATTDSISKFFYLAPPHVGTLMFGTTYVATESMLNSKVILYGLSNSSGTQGVGDCVISNIQLELGSIPTSYESYIDPTTVSTIMCCKNIIPYPFTDTTVTRKGVTFTDNKDGTITLNGTAEATTSFVIFNGELPVNGKYTLSGLTAGSGSTYYIQPVCSDKAHRGLTNAPNVYDWNDITLNRIQLSVVEGTKFSNLQIRPMLEVGETASDYEQYSGSTTTPTADGTCTITSKSPTMTLFTDTPGVIIEAEYNRDTTKMFESYVLTDEAKTEIAGMVESDVAEILESLNDYATSLIGGEV